MEFRIERGALTSFEEPVVRMRLMGPGQRAMITAERAPDQEQDIHRHEHQHLLMSVKPPLL
ncbi:hypothetical protein NKH18_24350 [Streptomyces sp. M10(2022)]